MEAFCFKCRAKRELKNPTPIFFANGSPATQGTCPVCGSDRLFRMGRTDGHAGMTPPPVQPREAKPRATKAGGKTAGKKATSGGDGSRSRPLVIVESPAKAKTIGKFLGVRFSVRPSVGHIRDLPKSRLGVDVASNFEPTYIVPMAKRKTVKELRQIAAAAPEIWLATDPDREGEAISWHLSRALEAELSGKQVRRVEFHEITEDAIKHAFANPREIDMNQVDAQQARRILDRLVGYNLSPLVSDKLSRRGLSAGRVQSVALRLVVEREREILAFVPVEYWSLEAELSKHQQDPAFLARLFKLRGGDPDLRTAADAAAIVDAVEKATWRVFRVDRKDRQRKPAAPFITSTMQQEASRKLNFNARRAMAAAQQLYEGIDIGEGTVGLITYMRTDSVNVAEVAQTEARAFITERYGDDFLPDAPPKYTSRAKNAQEAHEAIRPTSVFRTPESLKAHLEPDQFRLYDLIWKRFLASQMSNAIFDATTIDIDAQTLGAPVVQDAPPQYHFRATGSVIKFAGFLRVYEEGRDEGDTAGDDEEGRDRRLPSVEVGEVLDLRRLLPEQHFTAPPPRYTEASLVKALEEYGIGRPSTYATIMGTIQSRAYVTREGKQLRPTELGFQVNDLLVGNFARYIDVGFTAHVEEELDDIESGTRAWQPVLHEFYDPFRASVQDATASIVKVARVIEYTGEMCPTCQEGRLVYRTSRTGRFIGCERYPKCTHTAPLTIPGVVCPKCGGKLTERRMKKGNRAFYGCVNYPNCDFTTWQRPLPLACPTGDGGLMVDAGQGKAKCLACGTAIDVPETAVTA
ncbi:MAG: type I DNA topoisomerase [Thermoflexales bacterium]|nr:type I DNA topoisomerase [Thermoflexales bacterium]